MRFVLDSGEEIAIPVPTTLASPAAVAESMAPAATRDSAFLAGRTVRINLVHTPTCELPPDVQVFLQVKGDRILPASHIASNTYEVSFPGAETTTLGESCRLIRSAGQGGIVPSDVLREMSFVLARYCTRFSPPWAVVACEGLAVALYFGHEWGALAQALCNEHVAEGWDWFADLFSSEFATVEPRAVIEGRVNFGRNVLVPRDGAIDPISLEVDCDLSKTPLSPPRTLLGYASGDHIRLSWSPPATGIATHYLIDAGTTPGSSDLANGFAIEALTSPLIFFSPRVPHGRYYIRMRARNATMTSRSSREIVVDVPEARRYIWGTGRFDGSLTYARPSGLVCTYDFGATLTSRLELSGGFFAFLPGMYRDGTALQSIPLINPPYCSDGDAAPYPGNIVLDQIVLTESDGVLRGVHERTDPWRGTQRTEVTITPDGNTMSYKLTYTWSGGVYDFMSTATATGTLTQ
jgi:hypothetical protein